MNSSQTTGGAPEKISDGNGTISDRPKARCPMCGEICIAGYDEAPNGAILGDGTWSCMMCDYVYDPDDKQDE